MSSDSAGAAGQPIDRNGLIDYFRSDSTKGNRVGVEYELLPVDPATGRAVAFSQPGRLGVQETFLGLLERTGYRPADGPLPPTTLMRGSASVNLEPGAQMELSGAPYETLAEVELEMRAVLDDFALEAERAGFVFISHGLQPVSLSSEIDLVPKRRYQIMAEHLSRQGGACFRDMMTRTASTQASFDFDSEADAGRKLRLAMLAAPITSAIFANSPIEGGREVGVLSRRVAIWRETDNARSGLIPAAVDGEWSFERYIDHALDVPAILVRAPDGGVEYAGGVPFRQILEQGIHGRQATLADWEMHLSTLFTEARIKRVIEVRSSDACPPEAAMAIPALWTGLLYHRPSLDAALAMLQPHRRDWRELNTLASAAGLRGQLESGVRVLDLARELVRAARAGLEARGLGEERYLEAVEEWIAEGRSPAERSLEAFRSGGIGALVEAARIKRRA